MTSFTMSDMGGSTVHTVSYDVQGRVTSFTGMAMGIIRNKYFGNVIIDSFGLSGSDSIILNSMGLISTTYIMNVNRSWVYGTDNYFYDNNGKQIKSLYVNSAYADSSKYTWKNGDLQFDGNTQYEYSTANNANGNYQQSNCLINFGLDYKLFGLNTSHLLKSMTNGGNTTSLSYTYDSLGNISTIKTSGYNAGLTITNSFSCK